MDIVNPFSNNKPIEDPERFYNRRLELSRLLNSLLGSGQCQSIVGQYKIGKTSFVKCLFHPLTLEKYSEAKHVEKCQILYIDCSEQKDLSNRENFYRMLVNESIQNQIIPDSRRRYEEITFKRQWEYILDEIDKQGRRLYVVFDEFESIFLNEALIKENVFGELHLHRTNFTWLTCTSSYLHILAEKACQKSGLSDRLQRDMSDFSLSSQPCILGLFTEKDIDDLVKNTLRKTPYTFSKPDLNLVKSCGGNFPYFVQRASYYLFNAYYMGNVQTEDIFLNFTQEVTPIWDRYWKRLTDSQKRILHSLANDKAVSETRDLKELIDLALVQEDARGRCRPFSEKFATFILQKEQPSVSEPKITPVYTTTRSPAKSSSPKIQADILLVTATKVEFDAVRDALKVAKRSYKKQVIGRKTYYSIGKIKGARVFIVRTGGMGSGTPGGAQATIANALEDLSPTVVIMVGIAFGTRRDKHAIGDILVSQWMRAYDPERVGTRKKDLYLKPRGERVSASQDLLDKFINGETENWKGAPVHFGLLLSGEKLVDNKEFRARLLNLELEAIGGDMETAGLYTAVRNHSDFKDRYVHWIVVKGICDWGDGYKGQSKRKPSAITPDKQKRDLDSLDEITRQRLAARNAALFVIHVLRLGDIVELSKQDFIPL
jgi:nucleoside phosphorylase